MKFMHGVKTRIVVVAAIALATVFGCGKKQEVQPIKLGADITLTGQLAYWGQQVKRGLDVSVKEANQNSTERPIEILYEDNQGEAKNGIAVFQRFATVDKVSAVLSILTPICKPLRPLAAQYKIPLVATVVSAAGFGQENEWSFRDFPPQDQQARAIAVYAFEKLNVRRAVSLVVNDDYGRDGEKMFTAEFEKLGGKVVGNETVAQKDSDARAQATKLIASNPDCLFIVVRDSTLGICVRQFRELGFKGHIVGVNAFDAPVVWNSAGESGEGVVFTSAYIDYVGNPAATSFATQYKSIYNEDPDWVAVYGFTIGQYVCALARKADGDSDRLRSAIATLDTESIRGKLKMNADRDVLSPIGVYERKSGSKVLLKKVD